MTIKDYLEDGYKPYRYVYKHKKFELKPCDKPYHFSSMDSGYSDVRLVKEGFPTIIFGLTWEGTLDKGKSVIKQIQ